MMNFEAFKATRREVRGIAEALATAGLTEHDECIDPDAVGLMLYTDENHWIEILDDGRFMLTLGNESWCSVSLDTLEPILFRYCAEEIWPFA